MVDLCSPWGNHAAQTITSNLRPHLFYATLGLYSV